MLPFENSHTCSLARGSQAGVVYPKLPFTILLSVFNLKRKLEGDMQKVVKEDVADRHDRH